MKKLIQFFEALKKDVPIATEAAIDNTKDVMLHLNKEQLLEGKTNTGDDMPSYLNDPYFKSRESAQRYSDWKDKITPNPKRKKGISNLYINGTFHNSIKLTVKNGRIIYEAGFKATEIESKNPDIYGLNSEKKKVYAEETLRPELIKSILSQIQ